VILYLLLFFTFVAPDPEDALTTSFRLLLPVVEATKTPGALIIPCHKDEENLQQEEKVVIVGVVVVVVVVVVRLLSARPSCSSTAILLLPLCFLKMLNYMNSLLLRKGKKKRQKLGARNLKNTSSSSSSSSSSCNSSQDCLRLRFFAFSTRALSLSLATGSTGCPQNE
jgi:hypothetical protein